MKIYWTAVTESPLIPDREFEGRKLKGTSTWVVIGFFMTIFCSGCENSLLSSSSPLNRHNAESSFIAPPAVSPEERMDEDPTPGQYIAFSLTVAKNKLLDVGKKQNYRVLLPVIYNLGGINKIDGLVYEPKTRDVILLGRYDAEREALTLDDLAIVLQARFIHKAWPAVSLDPPSSGEKDEFHFVRFVGGIEDSQFGADLLDADYRMKRIAIGNLPSGVPQFKSYWDFSLKRFINKKRTRYNHLVSRFWFFPILDDVNISAQGDVVSISGMKVGLFTEVLHAEINGRAVSLEDLPTIEDDSAVEFETNFNLNFKSLTKAHPTFSRLQGLLELVGLIHGIENMENRPDLDFFLKNYKVKRVETPNALKAIHKRKKIGPVVKQEVFSLTGGVQLMAIARRFEAGDISALQEAVLMSRPSPKTLRWNFVIGEWLIPTGTGMITMEDVTPLFVQAVYLSDRERHDAAIALYKKILDLRPGWELAYNNRGNAYGKKKEYKKAIADFSQAVAIKSNYTLAYYNRSLAFQQIGETDKALEDLNKVIELSPNYANAYIDRGLIKAGAGKEDQALADYRTSINLNEENPRTYYNRGNLYHRQGQHKLAIDDYTKVLEINPSDAETYNNRGSAYHDLHLLDEAIKDYSQAVALSQTEEMYYFNRGNAYREKGLLGRSIEDYSRAIKLAPASSEILYNRGTTYQQKGQNDEAIADFTRALEVSPKYAKAFNNRGISYLAKGNLGEAISDFNNALDINPDYTNALMGRGMANTLLEKPKKAIEDFNHGLKLNPDCGIFYFMRGNSYVLSKKPELAISDFTTALNLYPENACGASIDFGPSTKAFSGALDLDSSLGAIYQARGVTYLLVGESAANACVDLRRACDHGMCEILRVLRKRGDCD